MLKCTGTHDPHIDGKNNGVNNQFVDKPFFTCANIDLISSFEKLNTGIRLTMSSSVTECGEVSFFTGFCCEWVVPNTARKLLVINTFKDRHSPHFIAKPWDVHQRNYVAFSHLC